MFFIYFINLLLKQDVFLFLKEQLWLAFNKVKGNSSREITLSLHKGSYAAMDQSGVGYGAEPIVWTRPICLSLTYLLSTDSD